MMNDEDKKYVNSMLEEPQTKASTAIRTDKGFVWYMTVHGENGQDLAKKMDNLERYCEVRGWKPEVRGSNFIKKEREYIPNRSCPKCGSRLYMVTIKGLPMPKCEANIFRNGKQEGCNYVDWPKEYN